MSAEADVFAALSNAADVVSRVGNRIYSSVRDADTDVPAVTFERTDTQKTTSLHTGEVLAEQATISINCMARQNRESVELLADAVEAACIDAGLIAMNRDGNYDAKTDLYISTILFIHNQG